MPERRPRSLLPRAPSAVLAIALALACGPRIAPGPTLPQRAQAPPPVQIIDADGDALALTLLAGGSRWDPPGREGATHAALTAAATRAQLQLTVEVLRDHATMRARCSEPRCADQLVDALLAEGPLGPPAPPPPASLTDLALSLAFEGHPYQHPPAGWSSSVASLRPQDLDDALRRATTRATVLGAATSAPLADALGAALLRLPAHAPPDPALLGPPRPRGGELAIFRAPVAVPRVALVGAVPRAPNDVTPLSPPARAAGGAAACARDLLVTAGLLDADAALGPDLTHAAVLVTTGDLSPERARALVEGLPLAWPLVRADALRICPDSAAILRAAWPDPTPTAIVLWPEAIEDPWDADVPPAGYTALHRPAAPEQTR
jgi:hypothetical protein